MQAIGIKKPEIVISSIGIRIFRLPVKIAAITTIRSMVVSIVHTNPSCSSRAMQANRIS